MNLEAFNEILTSIWTVWAILIFAAILFWAWRPKNRKRFEKDAHIPLNDKD
ncbi:MAG: cbb3-type cytochrome c oxidase subunit 3 [Alphaproteobacteria bacterium]